VKILWHSVKPVISSGYGTQTALWVPALKAAGHDVSISCSVGLYSSVEMWNGIRLYPHSGHVGNYGMDVVVDHAKETKADIVWSWLDAFILRPDECKKVNWVAWVPADSDPLMVRNVESLKACRFVVAPTRFGQRVIREAGIPNVMYVPCAFDPKVMFQSKEDRGALRERFGKLINRDLSGKYLVNVVAANSGKRKNFPAIFEAWKMFYAKHPDAILYLHTEITGKWADGENLAELMKLYEIDDNSVLFVSQYHYNTGQIGNDYLNLLYNTSDVHLNTCVGEGFGLPIMDAQACGCPTIVPDFAGAGEIGFGLKITRGMKHPLVPGGLQFLVDPAAVADALEEMYGHKEDELLRMAMAEQAREYSLETVMEKYMKPVLEKIEGEIKK